MTFVKYGGSRVGFDENGAQFKIHVAIIGTLFKIIFLSIILIKIHNYVIV